MSRVDLQDELAEREQALYQSYLNDVAKRYCRIEIMERQTAPGEVTKILYLCMASLSDYNLAKTNADKITHLEQAEDLIRLAIFNSNKYLIDAYAFRIKRLIKTIGKRSLRKVEVSGSKPWKDLQTDTRVLRKKIKSARSSEREMRRNSYTPQRKKPLSAFLKSDQQMAQDCNRAFHSAVSTYEEAVLLAEKVCTNLEKISGAALYHYSSASKTKVEDVVCGIITVLCTFAAVWQLASKIAVP